MTWESQLTIMVRYLIGDTDYSNYKYTDQRIQQSLVVAGLFVSQDYQGDSSYTFDMEEVTISPDPIINYDPTMIALITLKSACLFMTEKFQKGLLGGIKAQDGDSSIQTGLNGAGYHDILDKGPCNAYDKLLDTFLRRKVRGRVVSSPYSTWGTGWPSAGLGMWEVRGFFSGFFTGNY